ncbi:MAG: hypothetical protein D6780_04865, partial [Candidatus Dadabacteria bacterium]
MDTPKKRFFFFFFSFIGAVVAVFSLYSYLENHLLGKSSLAVCSISSVFNCDKVNSTPWSTFLGVPLATWGFFFYL